MTETPEQTSSLGSVTAGLVVGAVIGAAVALLYAPKSGKETRDELNQRIDAMKIRVDELSKQMTEAAKAKLAETQADLTQAVQAGRAAAAGRASQLRRQAGLDESSDAAR